MFSLYEHLCRRVGHCFLRLIAFLLHLIFFVLFYFILIVFITDQRIMVITRPVFSQLSQAAT